MQRKKGSVRTKHFLAKLATAPPVNPTFEVQYLLWPRVVQPIHHGRQRLLRYMVKVGVPRRAR